jgi:DNA-binding NtrC family response regulator
LRETTDSDRAGRARILVANADQRLREPVRRVLEDRGWTVESVAGADAARATLDRGAAGAVLLFLEGEDGAGMELLDAAPTSVPVVIVVESGAVGSAVAAMKSGAVDCLERPLSPGDLVEALRDAVDGRVDREASDGPADGELPAPMVGRSRALLRTMRLVRRVAPTRSAVLVTGETGTGKELVARAVHDLSSRSQGPFVPVVCSALPESLLESELFGHRKGSFTGAHADREGVVRAADGGTLFLDEISTISADVQVKLLRVLEQREIRPVGGGRPETVDFRLVAATNVPLEEKVEAGEFREDLYYRLAVFPVRVPPLRERPEDIPPLAEHFRRRFAEENDVDPPRIPEETLARMMEYDWPGNVRELEHFVERALILHADEPVVRFHPPAGTAEDGERRFLEKARREGWDLDRMEREYILRVLEEAGGNRSRAAEILGVHRRTIARKMKRYPTGRRPGGGRRPDREAVEETAEPGETSG